MSTTTSPSKKPIYLKGVHRALAVLEHLAVRSSRPIEIAEVLGVPWATLHRTLSQLEDGGFIKRDIDSNRYSIGPRMWFIGTAYPAQHPVLTVAKPYIDALNESPDLPEMIVQLVERMDRLAVTLYSHSISDKIAPSRSNDSFNRKTVGTYSYHFPLHCGSKGQVLLAYSDQDFIDGYLGCDLEKITPETITDAGALRKIISNIRKIGYAKTAGDVQSFTGSIGAPVFDSNGSVISSVTLIVLRTALRNQEIEEKLIERLLQTTHSISLALGWRPTRRPKQS